ncbi:MAG: ABC transporter ATP-binding protein [Gemmatimonadota bacterium]
MHGSVDEPLHAPYDPRIVRRLLAFLAPYRLQVALAVALLFALAAIEAAQPWLIKIAIDRHIATGEPAGLLTLAVAYLALLVADFGLGVANTWVTASVGQRAMHDLRARVFAQLQRLPVAYFDRTPVGRLVTRVTTDVEVLNELFSSGVVAVLSDVLLLGVVATAMFLIDWQLALATLFVLPAIFGVSLVFRGRMRDAYREIRRWVASLSAYLQERVTGLVVVQLFRREPTSREQFGAINREHRDAQMRSTLYYALFYPIVELLTAVAVAAILVVAGGGILRGTLTFGTLVAFLQYAQKFFRPIRDLAEKYNLLQAAMASGERLTALLDEPPAAGFAAAGPESRVAGLPEPRGEIVFEDVWFRYAPDAWVLQGVSFRVPPGTRCALVGPTGGGKTTIASLLCRFYEPTQGRILLDGLPLGEYPPAVLAERLGLVLQDVFLFSGSVRDNIRLDAGTIDDARIDAAVRALGAEAFLDALPQGLDTPVGERGRALSTGQKQIVAFARALACDPPVLILDEATSSVDSASEALIERAVGRLLAGRTCLVIAHRLSTIRSADRILVLHHGALRESGTHAELLAAGGLYRRLYELQFAVPA